MKLNLILWEIYLLGKLYNGTGDGNDTAHSVALDNSGNVFLQMKVKELIPTEILCRQYFYHRDDNRIFFIL